MSEQRYTCATDQHELAHQTRQHAAASTGRPRSTPTGTVLAQLVAELLDRADVQDIAAILAAADQVRVTYCANGHERTPEGTYVAPRGDRMCRRCLADASRRYRARKAQRREVVTREA